jgi:hypothetical protein
MPARAFIALLFLLVTCVPSIAQTIRGDVLDMDNKQPIDNVDIQNIYTALDVSSDKQGSFLIAASSGQLLEFKKDGYKTTRVRIPQGYVPSYFRIIMKKGITPITDALANRNNRYDYKSDSIRFHDIYKTEIDFPKLSGIDMVASPFSGLSKQNREIWKFQDDYEAFEKEKYVDKTFTEALVTKFTGLTGDSLRYFMRRYRPTYEQLKSMNDYSFYNFIKTGVYHYRSRSEPRNSR